MTLVNCRECGKLITSTGDALCDDCYADREKEMVKVRDCLRLNPQANLLELSSKTGISTGRLIKFLHEGLIDCGG